MQSRPALVLSTPASSPDAASQDPAAAGSWAGSRAPSRSIWVGCCDPQLDEDDIRSVFLSAGVIESIILQPQKECAFVNYTSVEEARTCLETLNGYQLGSMTVTLDYGRRDAASHPDAVGEKNSPSPSLWVGNVEDGTGEDELMHLFAVYGPVASIVVMGGRSCAFVNYYDIDSAIVARRALYGKRVGGMRLRIRFSESKQGHADGPHDGDGARSGEAPQPLRYSFSDPHMAFAQQQGSASRPGGAAYAGSQSFAQRGGGGFSISVEEIGRSSSPSPPYGSSPIGPGLHHHALERHESTSSLDGSSTRATLSTLTASSSRLSNSSSTGNLGRSNSGSIALPPTLLPDVPVTVVPLTGDYRRPAPLASPNPSAGVMREGEEPFARVIVDGGGIVPLQPTRPPFSVKRIAALTANLDSQSPPAERYNAHGGSGGSSSGVPSPAARETALTLFTDLRGSMLTMVTDRTCCTFLRKLWSVLDAPTRELMLADLQPLLPALSVDRNGTWIVQTLIKTTASVNGQFERDNNFAEAILSTLHPHLLSLTTSSTGHHVLKCIAEAGPRHNRVLMSVVALNLLHVMSDAESGVKVIKSLLENGTKDQKLFLLSHLAAALASGEHQLPRAAVQVGLAYVLKAMPVQPFLPSLALTFVRNVGEHERRLREGATPAYNFISRFVADECFAKAAYMLLPHMDKGSLMQLVNDIFPPASSATQPTNPSEADLKNLLRFLSAPLGPPFLDQAVAQSDILERTAMLGLLHSALPLLPPPLYAQLPPRLVEVLNRYFYAFVGNAGGQMTGASTSTGNVPAYGSMPFVPAQFHPQQQQQQAMYGQHGGMLHVERSRSGPEAQSAVNFYAAYGAATGAAGDTEEAMSMSFPPPGFPAASGPRAGPGAAGAQDGGKQKESMWLPSHMNWLPEEEQAAPDGQSQPNEQDQQQHTQQQDQQQDMSLMAAIAMTTSLSNRGEEEEEEGDDESEGPISREASYSLFGPNPW